MSDNELELELLDGLLTHLESQVARKPAEPTFRCGICGEEKKMKQLASTGALRGHQCQACYFAKVDGGW